MWVWLFWLSFYLNLFLLVYIRWLLNGLENLNQQLIQVSNSIVQYIGHVTSVHEMEMFYGDTTLKSLIEHGNQLIESLESVDILLTEEIDDDVDQLVEN